ncbi:carbohydrate ABC transporter permease [Evansella tamaricis]|uniref:Sugar ABC transporter permease n=1 Tax=Evansella tamaricis TaxID=2069301 RepID=A0ABS6JDQ1_9BACI|nr:sugar ABC transporter permease [Evansella tamaricis]MBU9710570.1 sugar ABC transporter permease [Evansella tamaricis]
MNSNENVSINMNPNPMPSKGINKNKLKKMAVPYVLVLPALLFVVGVLGYAVIAGTFMSFWGVDLNVPGSPFVGLENYIYLFTTDRFIGSLLRSLVFVFGSVFIGLVFAMGFALSLYKAKKFSNFFKGLALIPFLVSGIATAVMFRFVFSGDVGLINMILATMGIDQILFLSSPNWALFISILANVWFVCPFATLILLAGIQSIDQELFEAAIVDGANKIVIFGKIILPLIAPMMGISLIWLSFASFNMFDVILPLTGGGPGRATEVMAVYMYNVAFNELKYSLGSAVMVIILLFNVVTSFIYLKIFKVTE